MGWVKRNLYFLIGSLVALVLMGVGGFYLWSKINEEASVTEEIGKQYDLLKELSKQNPHPGEAGSKTDNVQAAKDQDKALRAYVAKARGYFQRTTPIPDAPKVTGAEFATQLPNTVAQMTREAQQASVLFPTNYYFSFEAQRQLVTFDPASLDKLAVSLGDIKALCEILFNAKINYLEAVKREVLSATNDTQSGDYLSLKTVSTPLAELTPYELDFRCFSAELAAVLSGLANSPYGIVVKTVNVEPAVVNSDINTPGNFVPPNAQFPPPFVQRPRTREERYNLPAMQYSSPPVAAPPPPVMPTQVTFLTEHPLRVTLQVVFIKLKTPK
jgi:hypothetical protein